MDHEEKLTQKSVRKFFKTLVGYIVVIGAIVSAVAGILEVQSTPQKTSSTSSTAGQYAEDVKSDVLYKVTHVLDGDTITAKILDHEVKFRLIGIDTPEVVDPRKPVQCYGPEASAKAKELLTGREIYIEREEANGNYDKYGRVLAYIKTADGLFYNEYMIEKGFAREYTFHNQKYKYQTDFKAAQKTAQDAKLGLWTACAVAPI